jgi:hypothetical protein
MFSSNMKRHDCVGIDCEICKKSKYMTEWRQKNKSKNKQYQKNYFSQYYEKNKEKVISQTRQYYEENKDEVNARKKEYNKENEEYFGVLRKKYWRDNKYILGPKNKERYETNKGTYNKNHYQNWKKPKYHNDVEFRLKEVLSARIRQALNHNYKSESTMDLIGCSIPELRLHLEKKFKEGMSWDNHSINGWHIDHIIPCDSFDLTNPYEQKKCFHYSNLQPLWMVDNIRKGAK